MVTVNQPVEMWLGGVSRSCILNVNNILFHFPSEHVSLKGGNVSVAKKWFDDKAAAAHKITEAETWSTVWFSWDFEPAV